MNKLIKFKFGKCIISVKNKIWFFFLLYHIIVLLSILYCFPLSPTVPPPRGPGQRPVQGSHPGHQWRPPPVLPVLLRPDQHNGRVQQHAIPNTQQMDAGKQTQKYRGFFCLNCFLKNYRIMKAFSLTLTIIIIFLIAYFSRNLHLRITRQNAFHQINFWIVKAITCNK